LFVKFSLQGLFGKLELSEDTLTMGKHADLLNNARPWNEDERATIRRLILAHYDQFLDRVVRGRKMSRDAVHEVAQGRIWSGLAALQRKLVDRLGGLDEAI